MEDGKYILGMEKYLQFRFTPQLDSVRLKFFLVKHLAFFQATKSIYINYNGD